MKQRLSRISMQHLPTWILVGSMLNLVAVWILAFEFFSVTCLVFVLAALRILALELPVDSPEFSACDIPDTGNWAPSVLTWVSSLWRSGYWRLSSQWTHLSFQLVTLRILTFDLPVYSSEFPTCDTPDTGVWSSSRLTWVSSLWRSGYWRLSSQWAHLSFQLMTLRILVFDLPVDSPEFPACDAPDTGFWPHSGLTWVSSLWRSGYWRLSSRLTFCWNFFMSKSLNGFSSSSWPLGSFRISLDTWNVKRMVEIVFDERYDVTVSWMYRVSFSVISGTKGQSIGWHRKCLTRLSLLK